MPNSNTFSIKPIAELIDMYLPDSSLTVDPFARGSKLADITNDLDPAFDTDYHMDALEFLQNLDTDSVDLVLYDPPYSPRQVSECYRKLGMTVNMETTQSSYWSKQKDEVARILKVGGVCISFGWNSNGIGSTRGFAIERILLVAHGGAHNDTICTCERKVRNV